MSLFEVNSAETRFESEVGREIEFLGEEGKVWDLEGFVRSPEVFVEFEVMLVYCQVLYGSILISEVL